MESSKVTVILGGQPEEIAEWLFFVTHEENLKNSKRIRKLGGWTFQNGQWEPPQHFGYDYLEVRLFGQDTSRSYYDPKSRLERGDSDLVELPKFLIGEAMTAQERLKRKGTSCLLDPLLVGGEDERRFLPQGTVSLCIPVALVESPVSCIYIDDIARKALLSGRGRQQNAAYPTQTAMSNGQTYIFREYAEVSDKAIWLQLRPYRGMTELIAMCEQPEVVGDFTRMIEKLKERYPLNMQPAAGAAPDAPSAPTSGAALGEKESAKGIPAVKHLAWLRQNIAEYFNLDELCTLCFDMGIKHENLAASTLDGMARELVDYCKRTGKIRDLVAKLTDLRPKVPWEVTIAPL